MTLAQSLLLIVAVASSVHGQTFLRGSGATLLGTGATVYKDRSPDKKAVAHYKLDGDATDARGAHNGTATNVTWAAGRFGQGASFAGTGLIESATTASLSGDFTMAVWLYSASDGGTTIRPILSMGYNSNSSAMIYEQVDMHFIIFKSAGGGLSTINSRVNVDQGAWRHICWTRTDGAMRLYRDGQLLFTTAASYAIPVVAQPIELGDAPTRAFADSYLGLLDDVRIYDYALSERDIRRVMLGLAPLEGGE